MKDTKTIGIGAGIVVGIIALLAWGQFTGTATAGMWQQTEVPCLPGGHANIAQHIHPHLTITVDGTSERIPGNIGVTSACMAEVHTHDASGELHVETVSTGVNRTLADFFAVWDTSFDRTGYDVAITVNGNSYTGTADALILRDRQQIQVAYTSVTATTTSTTTSNAE